MSRSSERSSSRIAAGGVRPGNEFSLGILEVSSISLTFVDAAGSRVGDEGKSLVYAPTEEGGIGGVLLWRGALPGVNTWGFRGPFDTARCRLRWGSIACGSSASVYYNEHLPPLSETEAEEISINSGFLFLIVMSPLGVCNGFASRCIKLRFC